jgi:hypothetical protein
MNLSFAASDADLAITFQHGPATDKEPDDAHGNSEKDECPQRELAPKRWGLCSWAESSVK